MFSNYEALNCKGCEKAFMGRRPADGGVILCPECIDADTLPVINDNESVSGAVLAEFENGSGDDNE